MFSLSIFARFYKKTNSKDKLECFFVDVSRKEVTVQTFCPRYFRTIFFSIRERRFVHARRLSPLPALKKKAWKTEKSKKKMRVRSIYCFVLKNLFVFEELIPSFPYFGDPSHLRYQFYFHTNSRLDILFLGNSLQLCFIPEIKIVKRWQLKGRGGWPYRTVR